MTEAKKSIAASLLPEYDHEMAGARKTLERIPEAALDWRPHPKSFSMIELASHVADIPSWVGVTVELDSFDMSPGGVPTKTAPLRSVAALLQRFDENVAAGRAALESASDESLFGNWTFLANGEVIFTMPRVAVLRSFVMNHLVHHRAQLALYLRQNDLPVPALYGPSADEQG